MALLHAVFNHVVLPPKLPGGADSDPDAISHELITRLIRACETLQSFAEPPWENVFLNLRGSLRSCIKINQGRLEKRVLLEHFQQLKPHRTLILYVVEQNAALIVRRQIQNDEDLVIFEAFETSPTSEQVLAAQSGLVWSFPGRSVQIPFTKLDEAFLEALATFLEQASMESIASLQAQTLKANVAVAESRDTTDPALITQLLMPLLEAFGGYANVPQIRKRIRDDLNFVKADLPWRRLPYWLVLRVAAQTHLSQSIADGKFCYKLLMCIFLAHLLKDSAKTLDPNQTLMLKAKLCRRMAKVEMEKDDLAPAIQGHFARLFSQVSDLVTEAVEYTSTHVQNTWQAFKRQAARRVCKLPARASPEALQLLLPQSGKYLDGLLSASSFANNPVATTGFAEIFDRVMQKERDFTNQIFRIAAIESQIEHQKQEIPLNARHSATLCHQMAIEIDGYFDEVGSFYDSDPFQTSTKILNLFQLFVQMDACAVRACPLLGNYKPLFPPHLLDTLLLPPQMSSMTRLGNIQRYLAARRSSASHGHILSNVNESDAFAVRFVDSSMDMRALKSRIEKHCLQLRRQKEAEWRNLIQRYDQLTKYIENGRCVCTWDAGQRNVKGCEKCWHGRTRKRIKILIHESLLPSEPVPKDTVVFELAVPKYISAYRNATWRIFKALEVPCQSGQSPAPNSWLRDCAPLQQFRTASSEGISLASFKKCFQQTHYKFTQGKIPLQDVFLPFAAQFELFDNKTNTWAKDVKVPPNLQHICGIHVPHPLANIIRPDTTVVNANAEGPSSYEIQANLSICPPSMSLPEFSACQRLLSGTLRRWKNILVELGASNLNFSSSDTTQLLVDLSMQAGPRHNADDLRSVHVVFREHGFVECLTNQIEKRLRSIGSNWRETNCMELLVNLCLKMSSLSPSSMRDRSNALLKVCRHTTLDWIVDLRRLSLKTQDGVVADRMATYAFKAALLCRLTFESFVESKAELNSEDLVCWIQASIALQENLVDIVEKLPQETRRLMIRDAKVAYHLENPLRTAIKAHPDSVGEGVRRSWDDCLNENRPIKEFSAWEFLKGPYSRWVHASMYEYYGSQCLTIPVHYNFVEGFLMIAGGPRGKLPAGMRNDPDVRLLFGDQHLFTYACSLPNLTHRLQSAMDDQEVYFGSRGGQTVIRATRKDEWLEFIPRRRFYGDGGSFDLPASLVENCAHWLNLSTGVLEIRRKGSFWVSKPRDWSLNVKQRYASRGKESQSRLVDPQSEEFRMISMTLRSFVEPQKLTVYQPQSQNGRLSVEMKHLDLRFYVRRDYLFSEELKAEIDPNQDLGTWYGLESKVVLRDEHDWSKRSVIVPLGSPHCQRHEFYTSVHVLGNDYARYEVDDVLGRLTCPPEPRLLYTKAFYHALTTSLLPDPLTGRTGTQEALSILRSAAAQPWTPISDKSTILQEMVARLVPRRDYYPSNLRRMQRVLWSLDLTDAVQHDAFESVIQEIEMKSRVLRSFSAPASTELSTGPKSLAEFAHLRRRGETRHGLYERPDLDTSIDQAADHIYLSRDKEISEKAHRVFRIASMINHSSGFRFLEDRRLTSILDRSDLIGGFRQEVSLPNTLSLINQIEDPVTMRLGDLISFCRSTSEKASPAFCLSLLAFGPQPAMDLLILLAGISCIQTLKQLNPPKTMSFAEFKLRGPPSIELLQSQIALAFREFTYHPTQQENITLQSARDNHAKECKKEAKQLAQQIIKQWPIAHVLHLDDGWEPELIDLPAVHKTIRLDWVRRQQNERLANYIDDAQSALGSFCSPKLATRLHRLRQDASDTTACKRERVIPSLRQDLLIKAGPSLKHPASFLPVNGENVTPLKSPKDQETPEIDELEIICKLFKDSTDSSRESYSNDLLKSLEALRCSVDDARILSPWIPERGAVVAAIQKAQTLAESNLSAIAASFSAADDRHKWLHLGGLWPDVGPLGALELLRSSSSHRYGVGMKEALVAYGCSIAKLQHLRRLQSAMRCRNESGIADEMHYEGHVNWNPLENPDWLLLEIECNILIRPDQVDVARAIISPKSGNNSVLQMNMGKGKTSVIMPMAAAVLADANRLVRLIVPKPLLMQTAQTIQSRLGGLVGREIRHVPFSRQTPTDLEMLRAYQSLHMDIFQARGIILTSYEHILSYRLSGLQRLADNKLDQATQMAGFQNWLESNCRDVLDESDFTLAVKTQLNYPSGSELPVDGHPFRWQIIEELLEMIAYHVPELKRRYPRSLEILGQPGWFPMMQFLKSDVQDEIRKFIVDSICSGHASFLRSNKLVDPLLQSSIRTVICRQQFEIALFQKIIATYDHPEIAAKKLLIVRGLITHNIIPMCLSKRWNVQYGLRVGSYPLAVPYESRDTPSERAEWGHPDVAIMFTCLSFYYAGLNLEQFKRGLHHILTSEDPASQWERWIAESRTLPEKSRHWNVINLEDGGQMEDLWKHLRKGKIVINDYLNRFVFPVHARQFSIKLQASAWDIPLLSSELGCRAMTTGFSGTKDSLLPLTIKQEDLPELLQTNAEVLSYLLQKRNRGYKVAADAKGKRLNEKGLLTRLSFDRIRILIDAGAYIIEMSNENLARLWLNADKEAKAAVYFREDNRAWVMFRDQTKEQAPLLTTPFANRLEECVVYLDEAHTRGVDLKFPKFATAALTLSLKQTKDFTVQAAMRLRELKTSQRVVFFAPPEVDGSIRDFCGRSTECRLDSSHVVHWLLEQTCRTNEDVSGLYISQGLDFCKRQEALLRFPKFLTNKTSQSKLLSVLLEPEYQTLEQMYGGSPMNQSIDSMDELHAPHLQEISKKLLRNSAIGAFEYTGALEEVEQEREIELQLESVRETEKPTRYQPFRFPGLNEDILRFTKTGILGMSGAGFEHAFEYIGRTEIGKKFHVRRTGSKLYVSKEFSRTVNLAKGNEKAGNNFLRPVEWILWSPSTETALIIIPEEAEQLIARLRLAAQGEADLAVHLIAYSAPVARAMAAFNRFRYYVLPPLPQGTIFPNWFKNELGILAGRLYIDYAEWPSVAKYLHPVDGDEYSGRNIRRFADNPVDFLLEWLSLSRKAQDVLNTPIGFICMGRSVEKDHPFFLKSESDQGSDQVDSEGDSRVDTSSPWSALVEDEDTDGVKSEIAWSDDEN